MSKPSLKSSLIRIWFIEPPEKAPFIVGAGFIVTPEHAFTCSHVVNSALGRKVDDQRHPDEPIFFDFLGSNTPKAEAKVLHWFPVRENSESDELEDIAVLKLIDPLPSDEVCPLPVAVPNEQFDQVRMCGFPSDAPEGTYITGILQGATKHGWVELHPENNRTAGRGFSGTPAWLVQQNVACGMIVSRQIRAGGIHNVYMIPADRLIKVFPEQEQFKPIRDWSEDTTCFKSNEEHKLDYQDKGSQDLCITLRLSEVIKQEYEITLLEMVNKVIFEFISNNYDKIDSVNSIFSSCLEELRSEGCDNRNMQIYLADLFKRNKRVSSWVIEKNYRKVIICIHDFELIIKNDWNEKLREDFVSFLQKMYSFSFYIDYYYLIHYDGNHSSTQKKRTVNPAGTSLEQNDSSKRLEEHAIKILDVLRGYLNRDQPGPEVSKKKIAVYCRCLTNERDVFLTSMEAYEKNKSDVLAYQALQNARCSLTYLIRYIEDEIFQSESLGDTEDEWEGTMPISIEKRFADAENFLKEIQEKILTDEFEHIYMDRYPSLEREVDDCLVNLRKWQDIFYERRVKAEGNQGNVKIQSDYEDARHNLEHSLLATEKLWNKYRSKFVDTFDSLKEQVANNTVSFQDSEEQITFLAKLESTRQQLEIPLKIGDMATKFCTYIGPGITYIFSKL
jgi:hypothetical protein